MVRFGSNFREVKGAGILAVELSLFKSRGYKRARPQSGALELVVSPPSRRCPASDMKRFSRLCLPLLRDMHSRDLLSMSDSALDSGHGTLVKLRFFCLPQV